MKKIGLFFATAIMIVLFAFSASALEPTGQCGDNAYWSFNEETGHLIISGTGTMYDSAFANNQEIRTVIIKDGITNVSADAFWECWKLERIHLPTSLTRIERYAFARSTLKEIIIPQNVSYLGYGFVMQCNKLKNISVDPDNKYFEVINCEPANIPVLVDETLTEFIQYPSGHAAQRIIIPNCIKKIRDVAFNDSVNLRYVSLPKNLEYIGSYAFAVCVGLESIIIPETVQTIASNAFVNCYQLKDMYVLSSDAAFYEDSIGIHLDKYIGSISRADCYNEAVSVFLNKTQKEMLELQDKYFIDAYPTPYGTIHCKKNSTAETYAKNNVIDYTYIGGVYNLGEETYSFKNFGDEDSAGGHCFGMSATSSGYYLGLLSKSNIGLNNSDILYSLNFNSTVKTPICHYQAIQGKARDESIVAGGTYFKYWPFYNIKSDWKEIVNYVKNHEHDGAGDLIIGYTKKSEGCHAINFLRYEVVDGQERIYAYDSNFPDKETYFYQDVNGYVRQAVRSTFSGSIDCIALVDVNEFFSRTGNFIMSKTFYAPANSIEIEGAYVSPVCVGETTTEILMYEILDEETKIVVTPLVDNATFTYMDNEYSFDKINEDTYAEFTLSASEEDEPVFEIKNVPHEHVYEEVRTEPSCTEAGSITYTCYCGDAYTETLEANGHTNSEWIVDKDSTCSSEGSKHIECTVCEEVIKTDAIEKLPHNYSSVVTAPTCTTEGYTTYTCACGDSYIADYVATVDHTDNDGDEYCDYCDEFLGSSADNNCSHICHKDGFMGFIWKIICFFQKLFGMNPVCECGAAHY